MSRRFLLWPPAAPLSLSFSIFLSRVARFFLGGFSGKQTSVSRLTVDDPPLGEGGPLRDVSRDGVLFVEEQREELRLVSGSSVVAAAEVKTSSL